MRVATVVLLALCTSLAVAQTPTPAATATTTPAGKSLESDAIKTLRADLRALGDQYVALHNEWYFKEYIPVVLAELNDPENPVPAEEITTYSTFFNNDADKVQQHTMWNEVVSDKASALNEAVQTVILGNGEDILPAPLQDVAVTRTEREAAYDAAMAAADAEFTEFASKTGPAMQQKAAEVMQFEDWLPVMGRGRQIALQSDMAQIGVMNAALRRTHSLSLLSLSLLPSSFVRSRAPSNPPISRSLSRSTQPKKVTPLPRIRLTSFPTPRRLARPTRPTVMVKMSRRRTPLRVGKYWLLLVVSVSC
eukprot:TRINITY_DN1878_c1_g1_i4.p1 TRINITY_DN1878_c1_g1~~TRINITY_DN1878_c1_g1_i4.p1  ORF type:complete len:307 (-),score=57.44 TRINITY_DN1878_c1_g1_i4:601-1521(-)